MIVVDAPYQYVSRATAHHDKALVVNKTRVKLFIPNAWPYLWTCQLHGVERLIEVKTFDLTDWPAVDRREIKQTTRAIVRAGEKILLLLLLGGARVRFWRCKKLHAVDELGVILEPERNFARLELPHDDLSILAR